MKPFLVCLGIILAGIFYFLVDPSKGSLPDCPFYTVTQLYCPGCGSQRGLHALVHGNIVTAIDYNPLMIASLLFFIVEVGIWFAKRGGHNIRALSTRRYTPLVVLIIVVAFWILRNIPVIPLSLLAP